MKIVNGTKEVIEGVNKAAEIITSTMGGSGKNVIINHRDIRFTKDGVSVAKEIMLGDSIENIGARLLINAAKKTVEQCGDGTTLTCLFTKHFVNELKQVDDINKTIEEIEQDIQLLITKLKESARSVENVEDVYKIAYTSSKSARIANLIRDIYKKTGFSAYIQVEKAKYSNSTFFELSEGLNFPSSYVHPGFANNDSLTCTFDNPFVLIVKEPVLSPDDYSDVISEFHQQGIPVLMIAPTYSDAFITFILRNKSQRGLQICLVTAPGYGSSVSENLKDIKAFVSETGHVKSVLVNSTSFTLFNNTDKAKIDARVQTLEKMIDSATEEYDANQYMNRINNLRQSSAIIYVGANTEKEADEEFDRIEDAVGAVRSALVAGYVRGAGVELYNTDTNTSILKSVINSPFVKILDNANVREQVRTDMPYNTRTKEYSDTLIDPVYVIECALLNSFSLAQLLINTSFVLDESKFNQ